MSIISSIKNRFNGQQPNRNRQDFYLGSNIWPDNNFNMVKLRELSAWKTATLLYGNMIKIDIAESNQRLKKFVEQLDTDNNFLDFMFTIERIIHIYGASITLITPIKSAEGEWHYKWAYSNPFGGTYSYLYYNDLDSVQASCRLTHSKGKSLYLFFNYNRYNLRIDGFNDEKGIEKLDRKGELAFNEFLTKNTLQKEVKNRSGVVPAILIKNYSVSTAFSTGFEEYFPEGSHVAGFQALTNQLGCTIMWELMANVSRTYLNIPNDEFQAIKNNLTQDAVGQFVAKGMFNTGAYGNTPQQQSDKFVEFAVANPQLIQYMEFYKQIIDAYFTAIGLSPESLNESTQRTATEVKSKNQNEFQVIDYKRSLRENTLKLLIKRTVEFHNGQNSDDIPWSDEDVEITLNPNIEMDITEKVALQIEMLNAGLTTRVKAVQTLHNLTKKEAEEMLADIDADQDQARQIEVEQAEAMGDAKPQDKEGKQNEPTI